MNKFVDATSTLIRWIDQADDYRLRSSEDRAAGRNAP